jgi:hypothetical protein
MKKYHVKLEHNVISHHTYDELFILHNEHNTCGGDTTMTTATTKEDKGNIKEDEDRHDEQQQDVDHDKTYNTSNNMDSDLDFMLDHEDDTEDEDDTELQNRLQRRMFLDIIISRNRAIISRNRAIMISLICSPREVPNLRVRGIYGRAYSVFSTAICFQLRYGIKRQTLCSKKWPSGAH